ncbi:MAG: hypothetical protein HYU64_10980 [Armatimonadetes bacterium]|nr:hypothetical protein [Armatimonadota bacterium]
MKAFCASCKSSEDPGRIAFAHTIILRSDGTVWTCGYNNYGPLGDGTLVNRTTGVKVGSEAAPLLLRGLSQCKFEERRDSVGLGPPHPGPTGGQYYDKQVVACADQRVLRFPTTAKSS